MKEISFFIVGISSIILTLSSIVYFIYNLKISVRFIKQLSITRIMIFIFVALAAIGAIIRLLKLYSYTKY